MIFEGNHEQNLSVNNISLNNLEKKLNIANPDFVCNKLFRFIFPKSDPEQDPSWHIDKRSQPQRFLSIICNSLSIINELELNHWNQLCQRDCLFLEKSIQGIYVSNFDINYQLRIFKAKMSKNDYIQRLGQENLRNSPKQKVQLNFNSLEMGIFYNPIMSIDKVKIQQHNINDLLSDYMVDPQKIVGFINIAKNLKISRAKKKKMNKFRAKIGSNKVPAIWPLCDRISILYQSLRKGDYFENKTKQINLIQGDTSNLPFINVILCSKKQDKSEGIELKQVLVDSGIEICILTELMLQDFKVPKNLMKKSEQSLNIVTSNQISKNCILGSMRLDIWVVLDDKAKTLAKCEVTLFYDAGPEIILKNPILGTNFLKKHKVAINNHKDKKM